MTTDTQMAMVIGDVISWFLSRDSDLTFL